MGDIDIPSVLNAIFGQTPKSLVNQAYLDQANPAPTTSGDPGYASIMGYEQPGETNNLGNAVKQLPYTTPNLFTRLVNPELANQISSANAAYQLRPGEAQQQYDIQRNQLGQDYDTIPAQYKNPDRNWGITSGKYTGFSPKALSTSQEDIDYMNMGGPMKSAQAQANEAYQRTVESQNAAWRARENDRLATPSAQAYNDLVRTVASTGSGLSQIHLQPKETKNTELGLDQSNFSTQAAIDRQNTVKSADDLIAKGRVIQAKGLVGRLPNLNIAEYNKAADDAGLSSTLAKTLGLRKLTSILNDIGQNKNAQHQPITNMLGWDVNNIGDDYRVKNRPGYPPGALVAANKMAQLGTTLGPIMDSVNGGQGSTLPSSAIRIPGGSTIRSPDGSAIPMKPEWNTEDSTQIHLGGDSDVVVPANLPMPARPVRAEPSLSVPAQVIPAAAAVRPPVMPMQQGQPKEQTIPNAPMTPTEKDVGKVFRVGNSIARCVKSLGGGYDYEPVETDHDRAIKALVNRASNAVGGWLYGKNGSSTYPNH